MKRNAERLTIKARRTLRNTKEMHFFTAKGAKNAKVKGKNAERLTTPDSYREALRALSFREENGRKCIFYHLRTSVLFLFGGEFVGDELVELALGIEGD